MVIWFQYGYISYRAWLSINLILSQQLIIVFSYQNHCILPLKIAELWSSDSILRDAMDQVEMNGDRSCCENLLVCFKETKLKKQNLVCFGTRENGYEAHYLHIFKKFTSCMMTKRVKSWMADVMIGFSAPVALLKYVVLVRLKGHPISKRDIILLQQLFY